jgi:DNA-binding SARP family transcriptional activator
MGPVIDSNSRATMRFYLLGKIDLRDHDGLPLAAIVRQPRLLAFLAFLVVEGFGKNIGADHVRRAFWPDSPDDFARRSLNQLLYLCRKAGAGDLISRPGPGLLRAEPGVVYCDAVQLLERSLSRDEFDRLSGDFMPGFRLGGSDHFERWLDDVRTRIRVRWRNECVRLAEHDLAAGRASDALELSSRVLRIEPADEDALLARIEALGHVGDRPAIWRSFEQYRMDLAGRLDLEASPRVVRRVIELCGTGGAGDVRDARARPVDLIANASDDRPPTSEAERPLSIHKARLGSSKLAFVPIAAAASAFLFLMIWSESSVSGSDEAESSAIPAVVAAGQLPTTLNADGGRSTQAGVSSPGDDIHRRAALARQLEYRVTTGLFNSAIASFDDDLARHWCNRIRRSEPGTWAAASCLLSLGALSESSESRALPPPTIAMLVNEDTGSRADMLLRLQLMYAVVLARQGRPEEARRLLHDRPWQSSEDGDLLFYAAAAYASLDAVDTAGALLRQYDRETPRDRLGALRKRWFPAEIFDSPNPTQLDLQP